MCARGRSPDDNRTHRAYFGPGDAHTRPVLFLHKSARGWRWPRISASISPASCSSGFLDTPACMCGGEPRGARGREPGEEHDRANVSAGRGKPTVFIPAIAVIRACVLCGMRGANRQAKNGAYNQAKNGAYNQAKNGAYKQAKNVTCRISAVRGI